MCAQRHTGDTEKGTEEILQCFQLIPEGEGDGEGEGWGRKREKERKKEEEGDKEC